MALSMYYVYILKSSKSGIFYTGLTTDLRRRFQEHNTGLSFATKPYIPWMLAYYSAFETQKLAKDFELYLKSGSGKAFMKKRLVSGVLAKDVSLEDVPSEVST
jgi:putative endonuclease